jgi:hypothetical protein
VTFAGFRTTASNLVTRTYSANGPRPVPNTSSRGPLTAGEVLRGGKLGKVQGHLAARRPLGSGVHPQAMRVGQGEERGGEVDRVEPLLTMPAVPTGAAEWREATVRRAIHLIQVHTWLESKHIPDRTSVHIRLQFVDNHASWSTRNMRCLPMCIFRIHPGWPLYADVW